MTSKVTFISIYFLSPLIPIVAILNSNPSRYSDMNALIAMIMGAAAYTWLTAEFVLISRTKFIEKYFGLDKFYRFHGIMAVISVALAFMHKLIEGNIMGEFFTTEVGDKALYIFIAVVILALFFMIDSIVGKIKPLLMIRKFLEKIHVTRYEYQIAIHNLTIIALIILLVHVLLTYSAKTNFLVFSVYILYFSIGAGFYFYHRVIKLFLLNRKRFIVSDVVNEGSNMWTLRMVPERGSVFRYKPGQFGFLRILGKNIRPEEHPFSFSSGATEKDFISITIKNLGDFTSRIGKIEKGSKALIDGPYGKFSYLDYPCEKGIALFAGGVGITPVLSILRYMSSVDRDRNVTLFWGVNNRNDLIRMDEFEKMKTDMKNFTLVPVMFRDDTWEGEKGIIDREKIERILKSHGLDVHSLQHFICGPTPMLNSVLRSLKGIGIKKSRIHYERFSL